jgi:hypothetical protein
MVWIFSEDMQLFVECVNSITPERRIELERHRQRRESQCEVRVQYEVVACVPHTMQLSFLDLTRSMRFNTLAAALKAGDHFGSRLHGGFAILRGTRAQVGSCEYFVDHATIQSAFHEAENQIVARKYTIAFHNNTTGLLYIQTPNGFSFPPSFSGLQQARNFKTFLEKVFVLKYSELYWKSKSDLLEKSEIFIIDRHRAIGSLEHGVIPDNVYANDFDEFWDEENVEHEMCAVYDSDEFDADEVNAAKQELRELD